MGGTVARQELAGVAPFSNVRVEVWSCDDRFGVEEYSMPYELFDAECVLLEARVESAQGELYGSVSVVRPLFAGSSRVEVLRSVSVG